jgi:hypothetical protein
MNHDIVDYRVIKLSPATIAASIEAGCENYQKFKPYSFEEDGIKYATFHHAYKKAVPDIAWEADVLICCHPENLPPELRKKHLFPNWRGKIRAIWHTNSSLLKAMKKGHICFNFKYFSPNAKYQIHFTRRSDLMSWEEIEKETKFCRFCYDDMASPSSSPILFTNLLNIEDEQILATATDAEIEEEYIFFLEKYAEERQKEKEEKAAKEAVKEAAKAAKDAADMLRWEQEAIATRAKMEAKWKQKEEKIQQEIKQKEEARKKWHEEFINSAEYAEMYDSIYNRTPVPAVKEDFILSPEEYEEEYYIFINS